VLFKRLLADPRVPRRAKVALGLGIGYLALPFDLVPDFIPVAGALDDIVIVAFVLRFALGSAGPALVAELWPGPKESLSVVLAFAGEQRRSALNVLWALLLGVALPMVAFLLLAEDVWEREAFDWDTPLLRFFDAHQDASLTMLAKGVTQLGSAGFVALLLLAAISVPLIARLRREAVFLFVAVAGAGALNVVLKGFFDRPRPEVFPHLVETMTSSFPSGHTMTSAALALAVLFLARRSRYFWLAVPVAFVYAFSVALSRLYLGVHFPSDVVAGWCVSLAWVTIAWLLILGRAGDEADDQTAGAPPPSRSP
jgi:undecaprenyl-diphosphatase